MIAVRVLGAQPDLDRPAALRRRRVVAQRLAARDADLLAHEVEPRRQLGHRVLHLQPRVDLEEVERPRRIGEQLDRADADIARGAPELHRGAAHRGAPLRVDRGRRRLLHHLLVAALDRALALVEVDDTAVAVADDLDLDVPRPLDVALEQERVVAERRGRLAPRPLDRGLQLIRLPDDAHALAAAARRRLDQEREPDLARRPDQRGGAAVVAVVARHHRHAGRAREPLGLLLGAEPGDHLGRRPDEDEPGVAHGLGEAGVLAEEAVARVDRVGARHARRRRAAR